MKRYLDSNADTYVVGFHDTFEERHFETVQCKYTQRLLNTFAASYLNTQGLKNSCLKSPASTLVDLTFQSRALRSFSLNQLRNLSL